MGLKVCSNRCARRLGVALVFSTLVAACGSSKQAETTPASREGTSMVVENQGGSLEGHTPRGFAGSGTGLFVGDNLNPRFPDGDGVQMWLTFDLPEVTAVPERAVLRSEVMSVSGDPFSDLGELVVEPVAYDSFGPELFDRPADKPAATCRVVATNGLECDVTAAVAGLVEAGESRAQFRVRFEVAGDGDGQQDLVLFFLTDSNRNEPGIFTLELDPAT